LPLDVLHEPHPFGKPGRHDIGAGDRSPRAGELYPHPHKGLDLYCVLVRPCLDGDGLKPCDRRGALRINFFIHAVTVHVRAEVQALLVELLNRRGDFDWKPDDLIRNELFFQRRAGFGSVIHDANHVAAIKTVGRPVIPRIGVVKHRHRHSPQGPAAHDSRDVREQFLVDRLQRSFRNLTVILPMAADGVREIVG